MSTRSSTVTPPEAALAARRHRGGIDVRALYLHVLQPALYEIGRRWEEAEISIARSTSRPRPPRA